MAFSAGGDGGRRSPAHLAHIGPNEPISATPVLNRSDPSLWPIVVDPFHGRCIRRCSCVGQALATEAIAECIRSGGIWKAESNIDLLDLLSITATSDWDASVTVERINL
jgi:hypothetical protein